MTSKWLTFLFLLISTQAFSQSQVIENNDSLVIVGKISWSGNKITKDRIISRELELNEGDTLTKSEFEASIKKSQENLMNRSLFNFVTFTRSDSANRQNIHIEFIERWYIWPVPILDFADRNFNVWWETKDFSRINYGIDLNIENFRGRMEKLRIVLQNGYDKALTAHWDIPYIDKKQKLGMSFSGGLVYSRETSYDMEDNRPVYHKFEDNFARKFYYGSVGFSYRVKYNSYHSIQFAYNNLWLNDSLLILNPDLTYGSNQITYFSLYYTYKLDFRDYKPYPLNGYYFDVKFGQMGFGILDQDMDVTSVEINFDHYLNIYKRFYFAYRLSAMYTNEKVHQPYFVTSGIGLSGFDMRGYELVIIYGQKFGLFKSNLKFELIPMKVHRIKWIKTEKFGKLFYALYTNLFFDMGYSSDLQNWERNPLGNQLLWTLGAGVDVISFYDIVLRFEYSINKQKQTGFYLGLVAPI